MKFITLLLNKLISNTMFVSVKYLNNGVIFNKEACVFRFKKDSCMVETDDMWGGLYREEEFRMNRTNNELFEFLIKDRTESLSATKVIIKIYTDEEEMIMDLWD